MGVPPRRLSKCFVGFYSTREESWPPAQNVWFTLLSLTLLLLLLPSLSFFTCVGCGRAGGRPLGWPSISYFALQANNNNNNMTTFSHSLFFCPSSFCVAEAGVSMGDICIRKWGPHQYREKNKNTKKWTSCHACRVSQNNHKKINIFLRGKQNAIFIFIFFSLLASLCAVGERVVFCLSCRVSSSTRHPWVSPGENLQHAGVLKKVVCGVFLFLRFGGGGGGGGERLIEFRKRRKKRERRRKKKTKGARRRAMAYLFDWSSISLASLFSFFPSARAPAFTLLFYSNITRMANFLFHFLFPFLTSAKLPILWKDVSIYSISLFEWLKVRVLFLFLQGCIFKMKLRGVISVATRGFFRESFSFHSGIDSWG